MSTRVSGDQSRHRKSSVQSPQHLEVLALLRTRQHNFLTSVSLCTFPTAELEHGRRTWRVVVAHCVECSCAPVATAHILEIGRSVRRTIEWIRTWRGTSCREASKGCRGLP